MKSEHKTVVISILSVLTVTAAALVWYQTRKRHELEDEIARLNTEAAETQAAALKKTNGLEAQVADLTAAQHRTVTPVPSTPDRPRDTARPPGGRGRAFATMLDKPEMQRDLATQMRSSLDNRYATLFRKLNLPPAELEKLKNLLVDRQSTFLDVMSAARADGGGRPDPAEAGALMKQAQSEIDASIHQLLGDTAAQAYDDFSRNSDSYATTDQVSRRLSYSNAPLTPQQSDALVQILAETGAPSAASQNRGFGGGFGGGGPNAFFGGGTTITDDTITRASAILTPEQLDALNQIRAEQDAAARMAANFRSLGRNRAPPGDGSP